MPIVARGVEMPPYLQPYERSCGGNHVCSFKFRFFPLPAPLQIIGWPGTELQLSNAPMLRNSRDEPWKTGFKASWQAERNRPVFGVLKDRKLVFHGLRKSAVVCLLEAGATTAEVQALTGQSMQIVEHYAKQVNQQKLAAAAILKWEAADEGRTENAADTEFVQRPTNRQRTE